MTAVDHAAGLLLAVREDPADDGVRLVYADWLEEHGDAAGLARAEFVRVQVGLAALGPTKCEHAEEPRLSYCTGCARHWPLRRRERELLARHGGEWASCLFTGPRFSGWESGRAGVGALVVIGGDPRREARVGPEFRRGFVAHVTLALAAFEAHAAALFAAAPLEGVRLADREPVEAYQTRGGDAVGHGWLLESWRDVPPDDPLHVCPACLEPDLLNQDGGELWATEGAIVYPTRDGAHAALSAGAVTLGRRLAGLPALPAKEAARA